MTFCYDRDLQNFQIVAEDEDTFPADLDCSEVLEVDHECIADSLILCESGRQQRLPRWNSRKACLFNDSHGSRGRKPRRPRQLPDALARKQFFSEQSLV